ncbi:acylphosphatase [Methylocystis heyeri]|uniref:acylphosphatase n=1 Tax=Methylocystis heyeri TaxID=391905 RepID=A0A6B8KF68_9HYPH|nr:acylphosphatase [Methylocystis heyeri]QGM46946.1 acylphosphatase [Methylocystis heyeri]
MAGPSEIRRFVARGRVQGVGFRNFIAREARRLGLAGWVRNRGLDEVEIVAAGAAESLDELARLARRGPPAAQVNDLFSEPADKANLALGNKTGAGMAVAASV